ncbi:MULTISPECIES: MATE family efflux transporter [Sutcliffiella]|uniref:MATE family efflux transporter n=1 Tax=Sutcliffiella cohnii TaxID=33932 RepID=A0A223KNU2_9BACI|nr:MULTISPECIES: MATE family efflux transporter [Sutcliffiella]AST91034.1 hypothetical protein BC6307_06945 [Sutcliffiella cohnii]WBL16836.1 MATE family efflux transporter [Sutcliffiella sp. NC1]
MVDITDDKVWKNMFKFSLPLIGIGVVGFLLVLIDLFWLTRLLPGVEVISSFRVSMASVSFIESIIVGVVTGVGVLFTQYYGAKKYKEAQDIFNGGMISLLVFGVVASIIGILLLPVIVSLFGISSEAKVLSKDYLLIFFIGYIIIIVQTYLFYMARNMGNSLSVLKGLIFMVLLNTVFTPLLIYLFEFLGWGGMKGAASSTVLSHLLGGIYMFYLFRKMFHTYDIKIQLLSWKKMNKALMKKSIPQAIAQTINSISFNLSMFLVIIVLSYYDDTIFIAITSGLYVIYIFNQVILNFATGLIPFIGQNIGAGKWENIRKVIKVTFLSVGAMSVFSAIVIFFTKPYALYFITNDQQIILLASQFLNYYLIPWILSMLTMVAIFTVSGSGDYKGSLLLIVWNMYISALIPLIVIPRLLSNTEVGVWIAYSTSAILAFIFSYSYLWIGKWKKVDLINYNSEQHEKLGEKAYDAG